MDCKLNQHEVALPDNQAKALATLLKPGIERTALDLRLAPLLDVKPPHMILKMREPPAKRTKLTRKMSSRISICGPQPPTQLDSSSISCSYQHGKSHNERSLM